MQKKKQKERETHSRANKKVIQALFFVHSSASTTWEIFNFSSWLKRRKVICQISLSHSRHRTLTHISQTHSKEQRTKEEGSF